MEYAYSLNGGDALFMNFQINETFSNAGIPVLAPGEGNAGVQIGVNNSFANAVGVTIDTATFVTAQQTDGTSAEREVKVCISPDAVFRALMSGGGTEGTALTEHPVTTASTTGLVVTASSLDWASPDWDEGIIWWADGANLGQHRGIASVSGTAATVTVAFDQDTVVGDNALRAPYWFLSDVANNLNTTTLLTQADASLAVATGGDVRIIDMELNGTADSRVLFIFDDHALREAT